mgnify:CR=1 FL=1
MDAPCKIQGSIHVFRLVNNMCPGKWVHIKIYNLILDAYVFNTLLNIAIYLFLSNQIQHPQKYP